MSLGLITLNFLSVFLPLARINVEGFNQILFLFLALGGVALAIAIALAVIKVVLDLIGIDILGLARTIFGGK